MRAEEFIALFAATSGSNLKVDKLGCPNVWKIEGEAQISLISGLRIPFAFECH